MRAHIGLYSLESEAKSRREHAYFPALGSKVPPEKQS